MLMKKIPPNFPKTRSTAPEHPPQVIATLNSYIFWILHLNKNWFSHKENKEFSLIYLRHCILF